LRLVSFLLLTLGYACGAILVKGECLKYKLFIKSASENYFGVNYPYWFSIAQAHVESGCSFVVSMDGHGSIGFAQITPKFWDLELKRIGLLNYATNPIEHAKAQAYILYTLNKSAYCSSLWNTYQGYNRNIKKVNREAKVGECKWAKAKNVCFKGANKRICVWRKGNSCVQFRTECDINYSYGKKIGFYGEEYRKYLGESTTLWSYW